MKTIQYSLLLFAFGILAACSSNSSDSSNSDCPANCNYVVDATETATTIPLGLEGSYSFTFSSSSSIAPFPNGTVGLFTLANNELLVVINGACINLRNPILTGSNVLTFKDVCSFQGTFSFTQNMNGGLTEINFGNLNSTPIGVFN